MKATKAMTFKFISIDPETMGGTPVFVGTRVPIQTLFDYLEGGDSLEEFLDDYPTVKKEDALEVVTHSVWKNQSA